MKLATLNDGTRDGQLAVVSRDLKHALKADHIAPCLRAALDDWNYCAPQLEVLGFAMHVSQASGGAYDPCAGTLVNLLGFGPRKRYDEPGFLPPKDDTVALLLSQRQRRRLELDLPARRARQPGGLQLDLSAVAKGYGVDRLAHYLDGQGIHHYLVEVGGFLVDSPVTWDASRKAWGMSPGYDNAEQYRFERAAGEG